MANHVEVRIPPSIVYRLRLHLDPFERVVATVTGPEGEVAWEKIEFKTDPLRAEVHAVAGVVLHLDRHQIGFDRADEPPAPTPDLGYVPHRRR